MKNFRNFLTLLVILLMALQTGNAQHIRKNPIKVLYVGYDPSRPFIASERTYPAGMVEEAFLKEFPIRMPAFKELLSKYFTGVATMDCRDWKPGNSDAYDVTIFDFKPDVLPGESKSTGERTVKKYLPDNFSKPVIFIASTAPEMGKANNLKLDWLCLCLDADAHHINTSHPIFKGPVFKVSPTMEIKQTPDGIYHYPSGDTVPKAIPMWKVQNVGYLQGVPSRIGMVSRGARFTEGPDAEVISSGVCQKDVRAVALGRHGNYFLWGFGASPADMTEEGKKVFVNVVAYMKQFDGKTPITGKTNEYMYTTEDILERAAAASRKFYQKLAVDEVVRSNEMAANMRKQVEEKKKQGLVLTANEEQLLQNPVREQPIMSWENYCRAMMGKYAEKYSNDPEGFQRFIKENLGYIHCNAVKGSGWEIDEDVKTIGISNHKVELLDKCVQMLQSNDRPDLALRLLQKYTHESFTSADDWSKWLSKNRKKLFFSETNGYKFMINTYN